MVPDELTEAAFYGREDVKESMENLEFPIGLDFEMVKTVKIPFDRLKIWYLWRTLQNHWKISKNIC